MNMDFANEGLLAPNVGASYPVFVHRLALLLHASFGPSVAGTPLRFANPSPPSGWVEDFHFLAAGHAQHTIPSPLVSGLAGRTAGPTSRLYFHPLMWPEQGPCPTPLRCSEPTRILRRSP